MKTIYLVRHAKSSWDNPDLDDFHRPLNSRGEKDAPRMGKRIKDMGNMPDTIYSSPAVRALETAKIIAGKLEYPQSKIKQVPALYHAGERKLLDVLRYAEDKSDCIMIVGHNPGLTEFANALLGSEIENIPTAGVILAELDIKSWKDARWDCGEVVKFDFPKKKIQ